MRISSVTVTLVLSLLRDAPNNPSVRLLHCAGDWVHICFNIATSDSTPTKTHTHTNLHWQTKPFRSCTYQSTWRRKESPDYSVFSKSLSHVQGDLRCSSVFSSTLSLSSDSPAAQTLLLQLSPSPSSSSSPSPPTTPPPPLPLPHLHTLSASTSAFDTSFTNVFISPQIDRSKCNVALSPSPSLV